MSKSVIFYIMLSLIAFYLFCRKIENMANTPTTETSVTQKNTTSVIQTETTSKPIVQPEVPKISSISEIKSESKGSIQVIKAELDGLVSDEILWENRPMKISAVINLLKDSFSSCGANNLPITSEDLHFIKSRIDFIKYLPVTNLIDKLTYDIIRCYIGKIDRTNLVVWINEEVKMPKFLLPRNIFIVNDNLYQSSPYGVIKYKVYQLAKFNGNKALNAVFESSLLNDLNIYNNASEIVFPFQGAIIQKIDKQYLDLRTGEQYQIKKLVDRIELLSSKALKEMTSADLESKFENKPKQEMSTSTIAEMEQKESVKKEVINEIKNDEEIKTILLKISQSDNIPEIKSHVNKILANLVVEKIAKSEQPTSEVVVMNQVAKVNTPIGERKTDNAIEGFGNLLESFGLVGFSDNTPVTGKDKLAIAEEVIADIISGTEKMPKKSDIPSKSVIVSAEASKIVKAVSESGVVKQVLVTPENASKGVVNIQEQGKIVPAKIISEVAPVLDKVVKVVSESGVVSNLTVPAESISKGTIRITDEIGRVSQATVVGEVALGQSILVKVISENGVVSHIPVNTDAISKGVAKVVDEKGKIYEANIISHEEPGAIKVVKVVTESGLVKNIAVSAETLAKGIVKLADETGKVSTAKIIGEISNIIKTDLSKVDEKKAVMAEVGEVDENKLNEEVISINEYNGINYLFTKDEVKPHSIWAKKVNQIIADSRVTIKTIIPHFYMKGSELKSRLIILLEDDFYIVIDDNKMEAPNDWKEDFGFSFSRNLPEVYTCSENKVILDQMVKAKIITDEKRIEILNRLKCN